MQKKLFEPVAEKHDGKGRIVFICEDANGLFVMKPATGFKSKHFSDEEELNACFERQAGCGHAHAFYNANEQAAEGEEYPELVVGTASKKKAKSKK